MANKTDPLAKSVHGTNPQFLVEKILRNRIYANLYWKQECLGLTAETLVDKAMNLKDFGGTYGGNKKPTPFICLILKMLQIQPEKEIVIEFIKNEDYRYVRLLGAFYLRMVGKPIDIYKYLEPLYCDYRKIRRRTALGGHTVCHVDEFIDELLTQDYSCDIVLPHLTKRYHLEKQGLLGPRKSELEEDLEDLSSSSSSSSSSSEEEEEEKSEDEAHPRNPPHSTTRRSRSRSRSPLQRDRTRMKSSHDRHSRESDRHRGRRHRSRSRSRDRKEDSTQRRGREEYRRRSKYSDREREEEKTRKRQRTTNRGEETTTRATDSHVEADEIAQMNALRASLGLGPLKE
ncbi:Pre-mRNA-splicing factor 38 [Balamuthia mandrillaris]